MAPELLADRGCGTCVACCRDFAIAELDKPAGHLCAHSGEEGLCRIYEDRPPACRVFFCAWRSWAAVPDDWRPDRTGFVLGGRLAPGRYLSVTTEPSRPDAWSVEPYRSQLRLWAGEAERVESLVVVFSGRRVIQLLPEGAIDHGEIEPGAVLVRGGDGRLTKRSRG